jgi:hypothetical protein
LTLLEAGADWRRYPPKDNAKLIHRVVEEETRLPHLPPHKRVEYERLLKWLVEHGESAEEARADMKRWESWSLTTGEYQRKMAQEVAERKAREAREKNADNAKAADQQKKADDKQGEKQ